MAFYNGSSITLAFTDNIITDSNGTDIVVETYNKSNAFANISVSYNNINYTYLGNLNNTNNVTNYDLKKINYTQPVLFIKLDFVGENTEETLDIVSIYGKNSTGSPAYGWKVSTSYEYIIWFFNDCHYSFGCFWNCWNKYVETDYEESCNYGCELQYFHNTCDCINYPHNDNRIPFIQYSL